jgi:hypothetical protein
MKYTGVITLLRMGLVAQTHSQCFLSLSCLKPGCEVKSDLENGIVNVRQPTPHMHKQWDSVLFTCGGTICTNSRVLFYSHVGGPYAQTVGFCSIHMWGHHMHQQWGSVLFTCGGTA